MKKCIAVPYIDQTERYPTGCESISSVMLLQYLGFSVTPEQFIDEYLCKRDFTYLDGMRYGPHPDDAFIGSPYNDDSGSYGCYAQAIQTALDRATDGRYRALNETGTPMEVLLRDYIDREMPVVFWATLNMEPSSLGVMWRLLGRTGSFQWVNHQHCLLLVGYDEQHYYFNDPWHNLGCIGYEKGLVEQRHRELFAQAVGLVAR